MTALFFILIVFFLFSKKNIQKRMVYLGFKESMESKGYVLVNIETFENSFDDNKYIKTDNAIICYVHRGIFNFVIPKHDFSDIEIYVINSDYSFERRMINTSEIKNISII